MAKDKDATTVIFLYRSQKTGYDSTGVYSRYITELLRMAVGFMTVFLFSLFELSYVKVCVIRHGGLVARAY